jgi:hypothetical protein
MMFRDSKSEANSIIVRICDVQGKESRFGK